jgi:hypothetical protein
MRFLLGLICGVLLMVIAAFIADSLTADESPGTQSQRIVNWDVDAREEVHELTR